MVKKIALVGNMNNNLFAITRHLRDLGYDAHLFFNTSYTDHFHPKADTFSLDYMEYCHEVQWLKNGFKNVDENEVRDLLRGYDFYIGQGDEAAIAYSCGFKIDVYYPYGSDVYKYSYLPQDFSLRVKITSLIRRDKERMTLAQVRKGPQNKYLRGVIVNADHIFAEYTNEDFENKLIGLKYKGVYKHIPMPFIYPKAYELTDWENADVHWKSIIKKIRNENEFVLLYHGRQEWKTYYNEFTQKNTHHLIIGFANYVKKNPAIKAVLVLVEYGNDVDHSKKLISELGIEDKVHWLPKMFRKDLMYLIHNADVCCGEFHRSYLTFGTVVEAMQMKKPVIHHRNDDLYTNKHKTLYPLLNAKQPEEIEAAIATAIANPDMVKQIGEQACEWLKQNFVATPLRHLLDVIEKK